MKSKNRLFLKWVVIVLSAFLTLNPSQIRADQWTGIDGSVDNVNNLILLATTAVQEGNYGNAKAQLAATASNLEKASAWSHFVWQERQTNPTYVPANLTPLPEELTEAYYTEKMDASKASYDQLLIDIQKAQVQLGLKKLQTLISILAGAVNLSKGIADTIKGNPLMLPKNLIDLQAQVETDVADIQSHFSALESSGLLYKRLIRLKDNVVTLFREYRKIREAIVILLPEVKRIKAAMPMALDSIQRGMIMPLPPDQQLSFDDTPFTEEMTAVQQGLTVAELPWESGLLIFDDIYTNAQNIYNAIVAPTAEDTQAWNSFSSTYNTRKTNLASSRSSSVQQLTALGEEWRQALIAILSQYVDISFGSPVALQDCSGHAEIDPALALDWTDDRYWKSDYDTALSAPTGPNIMPTIAGSMENDWHEYVVTYNNRLSALLDTYNHAWQSAYSSMRYADWDALKTSTDPSQPYQVFVLKRQSLNILLENLNSIRSEANRFANAVSNAESTITSLSWDMTNLQSKADAYRQFMIDNADTVPDPEFAEFTTITESDIPGISKRLLIAADGISVLETEAVIETLKRDMIQFGLEVEEARENATEIGNSADAIAFNINRMLTFNDAIASKLPAAQEMLDYKFDYDKDLFLGNGDHGYLFDSLEILDNDLWQNVDTWYYHANPPDIETQIIPHVNYIWSCGSASLNRFAWLTEQIWSVTDNLTFASPAIKANPSILGTGFDAGESFIVLQENKAMVDEFTAVRFLDYHKRPYTDPMGYVNLDQIRLGLPNVKAWLNAQTGTGYTDMTIVTTSNAPYTVPVNRTLQIPFTIRVIDSGGNPMSGVPITLNYDAAYLHGENLQSTDSNGLASFYPGPFAEVGPRSITFSVAGAYTLEVTIQVVVDTDGDGCGDAWETSYGFDPTAAFDGEGDFDTDGLTNAQEQDMGTTPLLADTDDDGFSDLQELEAGSDPLDVNSVPQPVPPYVPTPSVMQLGLDWEKTADDIGDTAKKDSWYSFSQTVSFKGRMWAFGEYNYADLTGTQYVNEIWSSPDGIRWTLVTDKPEWAPRSAFAVTVHNDRLWLIGGNFDNTQNQGSNSYFAEVWVSDDGLHWNQVNAAAAFGPRSTPHLLSMGDDLWLIGGYLNDVENGITEDKNDVWRSADGINWTQVTNAAAWPLRRSTGFSSAVFDNKLWIMGGDLREYDAVSGQTTWTTYHDVWNSSDGVTWTQVTDSPATNWVPRYGSKLVSLNNRLWLFGGYSHDGTIFLPFEVWTSEDGTSWSQVNAPQNIRGTAFAFGNDLWSLTHAINNTSITNHRLWRSRGPVIDQTFNTPIPATGSPISFSAGASHVLAIADNGTLWAWGANYAGQLGNGTTEKRSKPEQIGIGSDWQSVAAGMNFSMARKSDGSLWAWGQNYYGELGNSSNTDQNTPVQVGTDTDWKTMSAGQNHALAIKTDGSLWAWGLNNGGQLGDGTKENKNAPVRIGTDNDWQQVSAGSVHSVAVKQNGSVWTWGSNFYGQLGTTTTTEFLVPSQGNEFEWSALNSGQIAISTRSTSNASLRSDGTLYLWGDNSNGQIGSGEVNSKYFSALSIAPYDSWLAVSSGGSHTTAILRDNTLWAWGSISFFKPADVTSIPNNLPVPIGSDTDWTAISSGSNNFSVAQKADGSLWAWGSNGDGQLGNGTNIFENTPHRVLNLGPTTADADGDWMDDAWEISYFGNTLRDGEGDYDTDGITDFLEFQIGTLPNNIDSDQDGMPDKWERDMHFNPIVDDSQLDADGDGLTNLQEYQIVVYRYTTEGGVVAMAISGNMLYVIDGQTGDLKIIDNTNPKSPIAVGKYSAGFQWIFGLKTQGTTVCVANGDGIFHLIDVSHPASPQSLGLYDSGEGYIQGFAISDSILAFTDGSGNLQLVDIRNPSTPVFKGTYDNNGFGGLGEVLLLGDRVYTTNGGSGIQIIDISNPTAPFMAGEYTTELVWPASLAVSDNLLHTAVRAQSEDVGQNALNIINATDPQQLSVIGVYPGFVEGYALSGNLGAALVNGSIDMIDLRNSVQPLKLADIDNISTSHISEITIAGDLLYARYGFGADSGVAIVNISKFSRMFIVAEPGDINHSGAIDGTDTLSALKILTGTTTQDQVFIDSDANGDQKIGIEEAIHSLKKAAGL